MSDPTLTRAPEPHPDDSPATVASGNHLPDSDGAPVAPPGYELRTLIGSGGMGTVYRAHDSSLSRDVAVKLLHARYSAESVSAWRFTEEARITARLQHPGIPPIHQVGQTPDGRPFLAMKLIKGETLDARLRARQTSAEDRGRFVGIFEQVAQAVGFAHSKGIIHRDLKPANVMVGGFGEVQVMDWGLAKELGAPTSTDPPRTDATLSVELGSGRAGAETTQAGSLLGTPAYMPPEQAVGAIDQIDARADVFGLGAILCVILTGHPPFIAESAEAARVMAARGKLDECFARLAACGAEPELIALCKRCLAPEAVDRPADAGEVARAVAAFRADAERRARQAEMDRATAEVKVAEERKRRRVQRALALAVLGLIALAAGAAWWIDRERTRRRTEVQAEELRHEAELRARQLTTERDVTAALNEVQLLRAQGEKQADDPSRWELTLTAARSALKRAEGLLAAGEPTDELRALVAAASAELDRDDRERSLLAELDRIAEENDVRFLIPIPLSRKSADRYAAAFRANGIDLASTDRDEAAAWLKAHRFRQRLTAAVRTWQSAVPFYADFVLPVTPQTTAALAAVGGQVAAAALSYRPNLRDRLRVIADAAIDDPFAREWVAAAATKNRDALKKLLARPEIERISSAELSTLADWLIDTVGRNDGLLDELLRIAYERFPGDFWVNFRLAQHAESTPNNRATVLRYLSAAVAARPRSVIARIALAATILETDKRDPTAIRLLRGASELDPTSPWPHLFLAYLAAETGDWAEVTTELRSAVRADPDTGFVMASSLVPMTESQHGPSIPAETLAQIIDDLIAVRPDHPGGYYLRANRRFRHHDYRGALEDFRAAKAHMSPDYPLRALVQMQLDNLERMARWGEKLPAVLRGELLPATTDYPDLSAYCAGFEKKYALAARFAGNALAVNPKLHGGVQVVAFAGWAVQAGMGHGTDAADLTADERARLRGLALSWLKEARAQHKGAQFLATLTRQSEDLAAVREPAELAKLPPNERAEWEKFWAALPDPYPKRLEVAPRPREVKP